MARYYRTQALVLRGRDVREADRAVLLFTREFGRLQVLAVSARKSGSKLRPHMECLSVCEVTFAQGRNRRLLVEARPLRSNRWMFRSLEHAAAALRAAGLFERAVTHEEKDERLWSALLSSVEELSRSSLPLQTLSDVRGRIAGVLGYGSYPRYNAGEANEA